MAFPVMTPSTPIGSSVASARRSSSVDTPPEAMTGASWKKLHPYEDCAHDAGSGIGHATVVSQFLAEHLRPGVTA